MLHRTRRFCVLCLAISSLLASLPAFAQRQMAALHPPKGLVWQRTEASTNTPDGPVLYQILFRSSATPGAIPKISSNFTLTNSLLVEEEGVGIHIGGLTIAPTGAITLCCGQSLGAGGAGGT